MIDEKEYKKLMEKVDKVKKDNPLDVNEGEDLSVGIMNLIGIEEHLFFTAEKTGKKYYYALLNEVRKMRVELLRKIVKDSEGEIWCTSKHLLSASMRMTEVGTKLLKDGQTKEAEEYFDKAYNLYNMFWALNLDMVDKKMLEDKGIVSMEMIKRIRAVEELNKEEDKKLLKLETQKEVSVKENKGFFSKMGELVKKAIDCCKE
jgi:tetratricopeptide (TPR) repeat protein